MARERDQSERSPQSAGVAPGSPLRWTGLLGVALLVAVITASLIGTAETLASGAVVIRRVGLAAIPAWLWVAAAGRAMLTQLLLALPVGLIVASVLTWLRRGRGPRHAAAMVAQALPATGSVLLGFVVLVDLAILHRLTLLSAGAVGVMVVLVCGALWLVLARWARRAPSRLMRVATVLCGLCALWVLLAVGVMWQTPLRGPASYALPPARPAAGRFSADPRPNILWIVLDTTRADRLGLYGFPEATTPHLSRLASESIVFERAIADGMWTVPSHASMFTGLPVRSHGAGHRHLWLDEHFVTVAQRLSRAGYVTCAITNNPLVSDQTGLLRGFQQRYIVYHLKNLGRFSVLSLFEHSGLRPPALLDEDFGAALTNVLARRFVLHARQPWLLFVNYMEAHLPYRVPAPWRRRFMRPDQVDRSYALRYRVYGNILESLDLDYNTGQLDIPAEDQDIFRRQYTAALAYLDMRVAALIDWLRARGELTHTWVIITADHGEYLGDRQLWGHRFLTYQDLLHVPLVIRPPGSHRGQRIHALVQLSDLYPTILSIAGLSVATQPSTQPEPRFGPRNLLRVPEEDAERVAVAQCNGPAPQTLARFRSVRDPDLRHRTTAQLALIQGRFKLIRSADGRRELYDLRADPGERRNLYARRRDVAAALETLLDQWLRATPRFAPEKRAGGRPDVLDALRGLGYIGSEPNDSP